MENELNLPSHSESFSPEASRIARAVAAACCEAYEIALARSGSTKESTFDLDLMNIGFTDIYRDCRSEPYPAGMFGDADKAPTPYERSWAWSTGRGFYCEREIQQRVPNETYSDI